MGHCMHKFGQVKYNCFDRRAHATKKKKRNMDGDHIDCLRGDEPQARVETRADNVLRLRALGRGCVL